jgi:hypothetical protein
MRCPSLISADPASLVGSAWGDRLNDWSFTERAEGSASP